MSSLDITATRKCFPALDKKQVYLDNAGGSQTLGTVIDRIHDYLINSNVQLGGSYNVGKQANTSYATGYEAAAKYINTSPSNIVLGSSTTQNFRNLSQALDFPPDSELIISSIDHESNIASWVALAASQKLNIKWWTPPSSNNPILTPESLRPLLSPKTALVTLTHASNILGTIHDIRAISDLVHTIPGALVCVDGVAYAPHRALDVQDLGVDFYAFSWYKVYGPHISLLYSSPSALKTLKTLGHFFNPSTTLADKLGLAGSNYELTSSIPQVTEYLATQSWHSIRLHEETLQKSLLQYLLSRPDIQILGEQSWDTSKRVCTISLTVEGKGSREFVELVDEKSSGEVGIRWGMFYSNRLCGEVLGLGEEGVVRVSLVHYNSLEEVNRLIEIFDEILGKA
ncbi:5b789882-37ed-414c-a0ae-0b54bac1272c [Sclerotinia trifoliorum]|uniref:5b789882-37ed-414c-a0ae-0b54bac1272c n=1 Tax=Sclerotinia trifoliorum TaxID=28548 RepID=A0A8H2ZNM9_9HELO|nr:5b789882-37ed-414c-a0ae-0b54bac1272c [Sclerotinia trifoliorum]